MEHMSMIGILRKTRKYPQIKTCELLKEVLNALVFMHQTPLAQPFVGTCRTSPFLKELNYIWNRIISNDIQNWVWTVTTTLASWHLVFSANTCNRSVQRKKIPLLMHRSGNSLVPCCIPQIVQIRSISLFQDNSSTIIYLQWPWVSLRTGPAG